MLNDVGIFQGGRREILFMDMQYVPACWEVIAAPDISVWLHSNVKIIACFFLVFLPHHTLKVTMLYPRCHLTVTRVLRHFDEAI